MLRYLVYRTDGYNLCSVDIHYYLIGVILSYTFIIRKILRFPSASQRKKVFSTCSSHMIAVTITYGSCIFIYVKPSAKEEVDINKGVSVLTTSVAPLLNPFFYTLRNKQVKQALNDTIKKLHLSYTSKSKWTLKNQ